MTSAVSSVSDVSVVVGVGSVVVEHVEQGGGGVLPGLSVSPAAAGSERANTITNRERNRLMEASVNDRNRGSIPHLDTEVSMPVGEQYKDYWSRRVRDGDLWAYNKLARCYERTGELREGLIVIDELLGKPDLTIELRSHALLTKAVLQKDIPAVAWKTINQADFEVPSDLRGQIHNQRGRILSEQKKLDPAIIEFTAAAYYFELAQSPDLRGHAYNNLASMYRKTKRFSDAHWHVDKAIDLWEDYEHLPHALDLKALIYIDEKLYSKARTFALQSLGKASDHHRWTAEFLCTLAKAEAGLGQFGESIAGIEKALAICDYLNDENFRLKVLLEQKAVCEIMYQGSDASTVRLALNLAGGKFRQAARKLGINHSALIKSVKKHDLDRKPARRKPLTSRK